MFLFPESATTILCEDGVQLPYADLLRRAQTLETAVEGRSLVLCVLENTLGGLLGYVTFVYGEHVPLIVNPETAADRVAAIMARYRPEYCWIPEEARAQFDGMRVVLRDAGYCLLQTSYGAGTPLAAELCLLASTSGSTGSPTFVRQSRANVLANTRSIVEYLGLTEMERALTSLPIHYTFGMSIVNTQIAAGGDIVLSDKSFTQREFWTLLAEHQVSVLSGVPYTYEMLDRLRVFRKDLPHVRMLLQAGGKLGEALQARVAAYAAKYDKRLFIMYGQTEATTRMAYLPWSRCEEKIGSIGVPIPGGRIELVAEDGTTITTPGEVGEMVYFGPNVCLGYASDREALAEGDTWGGRLVTGDLAYRDGEGFLFIKGRKKRIVKHYGMRVNLDEVEGLLKGLFPEVAVACVDVDDALIICTDDALALDELTTRLTGATQIKRGGFRHEVVGAIPVLPNGKTDYQRLKREVLANDSDEP